MFECPNCHVDLKKTDGNPGVYWSCPSCAGRSATVSLLRRLLPKHIVNEIWQTAWSGEYPRLRSCPCCGKLMEEVAVGEGDARFNLDVCTLCQTIWFDANEYESLPKKMRELTWEERLPQEARVQLAMAEIEHVREQAEAELESSDADWWQWVVGFFGVPVECNAQQVYGHSWGTWITAVLVFAISVASFSDLSSIAHRFGFAPAEYDQMFGLTFVSSFFIHGGLFHLLSNLYFFVVFGDNVEEWLGWKKYLLLIFGATVAGNLLHMAFNPDSTLPCIGASGGISGILAFYALQFPRAKLRLLIRYYWKFGWLRVPAWVLFIFWLVFQYFGVKQQLAGVSNVSALAHLGGVLAGLAFWVITRQTGNFSLFSGPVDYTRDQGVYNTNENG